MQITLLFDKISYLDKISIDNLDYYNCNLSM